MRSLQCVRGPLEALTGVQSVDLCVEGPLIFTRCRALRGGIIIMIGIRRPWRAVPFSAGGVKVLQRQACRPWLLLRIIGSLPAGVLPAGALLPHQEARYHVVKPLILCLGGHNITDGISQVAPAPRAPRLALFLCVCVRLWVLG